MYKTLMSRLVNTKQSHEIMQLPIFYQFRYTLMSGFCIPSLFRGVMGGVPSIFTIRYRQHYNLSEDMTKYQSSL